MTPVLTTQAILLVVAFGGWFVGTALHRLFERRSVDSERYAAELPRMGDTIAFISGAVGILLGLLLSVSVSNYQGAQASVKEYGSSVSSAYRVSSSFDEPGRSVVRQDLVCAVQSFIGNDWASGFNVSATGDADANLWMAKLTGDINDLSLNSETQIQAFPVLLESTLDMSHWRQLILLSTLETIPSVIWMVIFVSVFVLALLLALHLADRRGLSRLSFGAAYITLATIILALSVLDFPMHDFGLGAAVSPQPLVEILQSDEISTADALSGDCPVLTPADLRH